MTNLVAVARSGELPRNWASAADSVSLLTISKQAEPRLADLLAQATPWTAWSIHESAPGGSWVHPGRIALIGDAAHALTPYAAQGAAMAIEDAALLAALAAEEPDMPTALEEFQELRRPRLARVAKRGRFNRFVWHAAGPLAFGRDLVLRLRRGESLLADLDWLYGYDVDEVASLGGERTARTS